jgi:hypothetical protein
MRIEDVVSFLGQCGHRYTQVYRCTESFAVDYYNEDKYIETQYFREQEEAEESAKQFAFEGVK